MRYFCLHFTSVQLSRYVCSYTLFFSKDVVFPAQAEYSYFSADYRLKIFSYYSYIIAYGIFVLFRIYWAINYYTSVWFLDLDRVQYIVHVLWTPLFVARPRCHVKIYSLYIIYIKCISRQFFFFSIRLEQQSDLIFFFFPECTSREYYVKNIM